jgi:hypothetical protein
MATGSPAMTQDPVRYIYPSLMGLRNPMPYSDIAYTWNSTVGIKVGKGWFLDIVVLEQLEFIWNSKFSHDSDDLSTINLNTAQQEDLSTF